MKKVSVSSLVFLFILTMMISCSESAFDTEERNDDFELIEQVGVDKTTSNYNPSDNSASARIIDDGGGSTSKCYSAYLKYDIDCDGQYETAVNVEMINLICCWDKVQELEQDAQSNGWCHDYDEELQCLRRNCKGTGEGCSDDPQIDPQDG